MQTNAPQWKAQWIRSPMVGGPKTTVPAPLLRREFVLEGEVRSAILHITALGLYECRINGAVVGDHVLAPGWTDYRHRVAFQSHEVSGLLRSGANAIGVILGDGWYCGSIGGGPRQTHGDRPELLAQLEITLADGRQLMVTSDPSWRSAVGPLLENDLLAGESYDARLEVPGWDEPGFDDGAWVPVQTGGEKSMAIVRSAAPPMRRQEQLKVVAENRMRGQRVCDLGQNFTGRVRLRVKAARGRTVTLRHGEMLNPDGSLYTANLRSARATDHYTCAGHGEETWEPLFTFHGFRYVEISGLKEDDFCELTGVVIHSDMAPAGEFSCSNPLLNQLWSNIRWGLKSNFLDVPTDCPQRDERMGWTGDAQVFCRSASTQMDVLGFFRKWLQDMRDAQLPSGAIPKVVPNVGPYTFLDDAGPAWADAAIICPWTIYLCYGDDSILREHYDCMRRYMDYVAAHRTLHHIRSHPEVHEWGGYGDWCALDGSGRTEGGTPKDLIGTAFYANNADIMARTAALLGRDEDAAHYRRLHREVVTAFRNRFVTTDGLLAASTQTAYVLALHFGLIPEDARPGAATELVRLVRRNGMHLATGFVGTPYLLDVLEEAGRLDVAYALLEQESFPSWLFPIKNGATTIWERWDSWTPEKGFHASGMNSFNHYAYGAVGAWMMRSLAGIDLDPMAPGYAHVRFRPRPGGSLTEAAARLNTTHGPAAIRWQLASDRLEVWIESPAGATASFSPPPGWIVRGEIPDSLPAGESTFVLVPAPTAPGR